MGDAAGGAGGGGGNGDGEGGLFSIKRDMCALSICVLHPLTPLTPQQVSPPSAVFPVLKDIYAKHISSRTD